MSAAVFAKPEQVSQLAPAERSLGMTVEMLTAAVGSSRGVIVVSQRTPQAFSFAFIARDDAAMGGLIGALPACQLKPGVCVRIE